MLKYTCGEVWNKCQNLGLGGREKKNTIIQRTGRCSKQESQEKRGGTWGGEARRANKGLDTRETSGRW